MVIVDVKVAHDQACPPLVEVNLDSVVLHLHHPEYVVRVDVHVEVVNLLGKVCRSNRTGIQVESNEGERTPMGATVRTDELALAKAHVRLIREWHCGACSGVRSGPAAARMCVRPTIPSKSLICDGSLMLATGTPGFSGLWWTMTPKGLNGAPPPGIGLIIGPRRSLSSFSCQA